MPRPALTPRRSRPTFALTPLIDVIFLLLVFFMLSSQIAPYSLIPLGDTASQSSESPPARDEGPAAGQNPRSTIIRLSRGHVSVGRLTITIDEFAEAAAQLAEEGITSLVLIPAVSATTQDIVSVMEILSKANIDDVTLLNAGPAR